MSVPEEVISALTEANDRGILTGEKKAVYDELVSRGVIEGKRQVPIFELARESGFIKGYLDQASGISQLAARLSPDSRTPEMVLQGIPTTAKRIDDFIAREEIEYQKNNEDGIDWSRMAGAAVNPVALASYGMGGAATVPGKIATGTSLGAVTGLSMPVTEEGADFTSTKATQGTVGAVAGFLVPTAVEAVKGAWSLKNYLTRPFTESGRTKDLQEMYVKLAGEAKESLIDALDDPKVYIRGNKPTSAQAIAEHNIKKTTNVGGSIARMEKDLSRKAATGDPLKTVMDKQVSRRSQAIEGVIDSSDQGLAVAKKARADMTKPLYDEVKESVKRVKTEPVISEINGLIKNNAKQDSVVMPLRKVLRKMYNITEDGPKLDRNPGSLYSLSKQIKDMLNKKTPDGKNQYDVKVLSQVKKSLDKQIGDVEPNYKLAQETFKEYSEPINQIQVIRQLGGALKNAVEEESPAPFLNAIEKAPQTLKKSTGFARYNKLSDVLDDKQMKVINDVKTELIRQAKTSKMATATESTYPVLKEGIEPQLPNMLSRPALITNAILRRVGKDMGPNYEKIAVKIQENPEYLAELLRKAPDDAERNLAFELLKTLSSTIPAREISREVQLQQQE